MDREQNEKLEEDKIQADTQTADTESSVEAEVDVKAEVEAEAEAGENHSGGEHQSRKKKHGSKSESSVPQNKALRYSRIVFRSMFKVLRTMFMTLFIVCVIALIAALGIGFYKILPLYKEYKAQAVETVANSTLADFRLQEASFIYDVNGDQIAKLTGDEDSTYLVYDEIPEYAVGAFIAIEDRTFWENSGIDLKGIFRVALNYFKTDGDEMHGASTITQQLARNRYLTRAVSIERKAKEMLVAMELTKKYTKEQIMEFYINDISFANTYYGLQAASRGYFKKEAKDLSLSQIAYLCAIPNSPTYYNPYNHPENALKRRDKILSDMLELEYITAAEYDEAVNETITVERTVHTLRNYETTYALDCAIRYLMRMDDFEFQYGFQSQQEYKDYKERYEDVYEETRDLLYTGGYRVYTSLDPAKQQILQASIDDVLSFDETVAGNGIYALQGAATVVDNSNNRVVAICGGRSQESSTYTLNRAFQSFRQPGSSIKPLLVYAPALDTGYTSKSLVKDIKVEDAKEKDADVSNLPGNTLPLRSAVERSRNGVAWWLYNEITPQVGMSYLTKMRFDNIVPDDYYLAAALGGFTYGATTEEMAGAYAALVNNGIYREPTCLTSLIDSSGQEIFEEYPEIEVYKENTAAVMTDILKGVITKGTAKAMGWRSDIEAAGKTGTTNNSKDGWFCGMTPYYSMSVWVGFDQPKTLSSLYGATYPASIWKETMMAITEGMEPAAFQEPGEEVGDKNLDYDDENREISPGYTVRNYNEDHALANQAQALINQIQITEDPVEKQQLYDQAQGVINQIYGNTLEGQMNAALQAAAP